MKFSLTVQDLTGEELNNVLSKLNNVACATAAPVVVAPAESTTNETDVDVNGYAWNPELHSSTKAKNADGSWKKRRGSVADKLDKLEQSVGVTPVTPVTPVSAPTMAAPVAAPVAMPTPAAPVAAPVVEAKPERNFQGLLQQISKLFRSQVITPDYPNTICQRINSGFQVNNVQTVTDIAQDPRFVEYAWQCLEVDGKAA